MPRIRVALDARMTRMSGVGTYIRGLSHALGSLEPPVEVVPLGAPPERAPPIYGLREQLWVPRAFARARPAPDLLHVPHYNAPLTLRGPLVVTIHDLNHLRHPEWARSRFAGPYARLVVPRVCRRADAILCGSRATRDDLAALLPEVAGKIHVTPYGCDHMSPPDAATRERVLLRHELAPEGYVLYVGNLRPHKGLDLAIEAHARLEKPPALIIAGEDQMPSSWKNRRARARLLGRVEDGDLPALYAGAAAFVFPSWGEGFGLPPLEAMRCGAPVVCSDAPALPEIVGDAALIFRSGDAEGLATALRRLLGDAALARDLRERGYRRAREFTWARTARFTAEVYERVCARSSLRSEP
jgi:glycosyltransferase involved in cell wall biosynthesis